MSRSTATASSFRVLVVDDERPARAKIIRLLQADSRFKIVGEARDGVEALEMIADASPDIVVLDIQMPGLDGFEVLEAWGEPPGFAVVFSTAYDEHALRAFEAHAVDYLLKPYDAERFGRALERACALRVATPGSLPAVVADGLPRIRRRITFKTSEGAWVAVPLDELLRISAADKHTCVETRDGTHLVRMPLRELRRRLDDRFVQIHRSEIVNLDTVVRVDPWTHNDAVLTFDDGTSAVLTRTFRKAFFSRYSQGT